MRDQVSWGGVHGHGKNYVHARHATTRRLLGTPTRNPRMSTHVRNRTSGNGNGSVGLSTSHPAPTTGALPEIADVGVPLDGKAGVYPVLVPT